MNSWGDSLADNDLSLLRRAIFSYLLSFYCSSPFGILVILRILILRWLNRHCRIWSDLTYDLPTNTMSLCQNRLTEERYAHSYRGWTVRYRYYERRLTDRDSQKAMETGPSVRILRETSQKPAGNFGFEALGVWYSGQVADSLGGWPV